MKRWFGVPLLCLMGCGVAPGIWHAPDGTPSHFTPSLCLWSPRAHYNFGQDSGAPGDTWLVLGPRDTGLPHAAWVGWIAPLAPSPGGWGTASGKALEDGTWSISWNDLLGSQTFHLRVYDDSVVGTGSWLTDITPARDSAIELTRVYAERRPCAQAPRRREST